MLSRQVESAVVGSWQTWRWILFKVLRNISRRIHLEPQMTSLQKSKWIKYFRFELALWAFWNSLARRIWGWHAEGMVAKNRIPGGGPKLRYPQHRKRQGLGKCNS